MVQANLKHNAADEFGGIAFLDCINGAKFSG
jgi:hypothetical protein